MIGLQEKDDLKSLAIKRCKPEQPQTPPHTGTRDFVGTRTCEQCFPATIMRPDPSAPINFMKKPIHNYEQNDDGEESSCGLQVKCRHTFAQLPHDTDGNEPGDQARSESEACAHRDWTTVRAFLSGHARSDGGEHQDAFQSFAEYENTNIQKRDRGSCVRLRRIRRAMRRDALPRDHAYDANRSCESSDAQSKLHETSEAITSISRMLPVGCFF